MSDGQIVVTRGFVVKLESRTIDIVSPTPSLGLPQGVPVRNRSKTPPFLPGRAAAGADFRPHANARAITPCHAASRLLEPSP